MMEGCWVESDHKLGLPVFVVLMLSAVICQHASAEFLTVDDNENSKGGKMISDFKKRLVGWLRAAAHVGANLFAGLAGGAAVSG
jgi:hypothetical protein